MRYSDDFIIGGGNLSYLTEHDIKKIPQELINQRAVNGGNLHLFKPEQIAQIPQEAINQRVVNGGDLRFLMPEQTIQIPQDLINQRVVNGRDLLGLTVEQIVQIPQELINHSVANGGNLSGLTTEQIAQIPQEAINLSASRGGNIYWLTAEQIAQIPEELRRVTPEMVKSLDLYRAGEIGKDDLPPEVFANYAARLELLNIIKADTIKQFRKICVENGYMGHVPEEMNVAFEERLSEVYEEVAEKTNIAIEELTKRDEENKINAIENTSEMRW